MMMEKNINPQKRFVPGLLPWLVALAALVFYMATLNHWVSFINLSGVARTYGWTWRPELSGPLYWLLTYPLRWLPARLVPLGLNFFSAVCAVLTLALLARSVALLPHDRTEDQRIRERSAFALLSIRASWLPVLLAAAVCGLQLSFWEGATAGSAEMLDLLLFAYVIRCLLEFRIDEHQSWLSRAAFVYGLGMTNNWAMIGFFPLFLAALVWSKGLSFFNGRFLGRMSLWGLAGLSLYLLLPLVQSSAEIAKVPFWQGLAANLRTQKLLLTSQAVGPFNKYALFFGDQPLWVLALFSLLPLLVISISWPSYFGDPSKLGVAMATLIFHFFHAVLLVVCVWVALDPQFSPRHHVWLHAYGASGLPIYYLAALGVGYFSGYFLLVFGVKPWRQQPPAPPYKRLVSLVVRGAVWLLLLLAPAMLFYRNLPQIRVTNGSWLRDYATLLLDALPHNAIVLSDDLNRLTLVQSAAARSGRSRDLLFLDTQSLQFPDYHRLLKHIYPQRWPINPGKKDTQHISDLPLMGLMNGLARSNSLYYIHPSFGYYFEVFYLQPHGPVYRLEPYPTNSVFEVPLSKELVAENESFWLHTEEERLRPLLATLAPAAPAGNGSLLERVVRLAHLRPERNRETSTLAVFYSRALDYWGVELQRSGHLKQAGDTFALAHELNADNVVAQLNLEYNRNLRSGKKASVELSKSVEDKFGQYHNWQEVLNDNGPFDDPNLCFAQALAYARGGLYHQSAREFARVKALAPENFSARLFLAQIYLASGLPEQSLQEVEEIHAQADQLGVVRTNQVYLLSIEASADLARKDLPRAEAAVQAALKQYPDDENLLAVATRVYLNYQYYSNALATIERQLKLAPDNPDSLINKGFVCLQLKDYDQALPPLNRALDLQATNYLALLNRAIAYLGAEKLDASQRDYEVLQKAFPTSFAVDYGLGEVAFKRKDTNGAARYYERYLLNAPTNSPSLTNEVAQVRARLKDLRHGSP